ncbi:carbohydrate ABC transporter permease [Enterocloster clostridioformis]|uniref:carbohydrate ABC transporter permease n=2 Tax=Enterocloster clostridioformis TaxID=1531 RepID=UPI00080CA372|nr:carbohydrate ABC transporter permease [Enterocloster clostridioformis]ANU49233.1 sugar ABC transporter permease [Lachnoclostridium sp. YL32]NDO31935.1 carbohydrate ABC transporter permease [Enterocloster clostridioformis]OXE64427.1 carbohydrate ABC transporter permease [Enterocloster clostridioformis]QQR01838.1 carbohydrate ABC transporter permease [Enterocloster clostridioformis]
MSLTRKRNMKKALLTLLMTVAAVIYIYPIILMLINSVKPFGEVVLDVIALPSRIEWSNYTYVIDKMKYGKLFFNNVIITVIGIIGIIAFSSMSAYILSRRKNRYTRIAALLITTPMLIPFQAIMITLLKVMNVIHLSGSRIGLGIQYWGFGIPMAAFIYSNFMSTIPREIDESAYIDGAGTLQTFCFIIFPLLKSVTFTVIVIDVMWIWNDFLLPLLMVNSSNATKTLVLAAYTFVGQFNTQWHYAMAAMMLAVLPSIIIFVLLQKYIVEGVVAGAVKG